MQLIPQVRQDAAVQLADLQKALLSIRQARDSLLGQVHSLSESKDRTDGRIEELTQELEEARETRNIASSELEESQRSCEELRRQVRDLEERLNNAPVANENAAVESTGSPAAISSEREAELLALVAAAEAKVVALEGHVERSSQQIKESNARLIQKLIAAEKTRTAATELADSAQAQLTTFMEERTALQEQFKEMESRATQLQVEVERLSVAGSSGDQIKKQQEQIAELSAELNAAREELRLAWAIKQATDLADAGTPAPAFTEGNPPPLDGAETDAAAAAMRACLKSATESLEPEKHLQSLSDQLQQLAQRALCAGWLSTRRVLDLCADITKWLQKFPAKVESMAPALEQSFNLISLIANSAAPMIHEDTDGFEIYAVDDDVDNCECIAMSLDKVALRTLYASKPEIALNHLASKQSKLIILDVDLGGGISGFEIHGAIRRMAHHRNTPILFVSGLTSARERINQMGSKHDAYLAKPYNLNEITLKVLSMILEARLTA